MAVITVALLTGAVVNTPHCFRSSLSLFQTRCKGLYVRSPASLSADALYKLYSI